MPTPVGHALAGLAVGAAVTWRRPLLGPWRDMVLFGALAQAPDLDFLPGILLGRPEAFHHGASHSLGFALLAGLLMALWGRRQGQGQAWRWALMGFLVYLAQVLADAASVDTSFPYGVPLWWPLSDAYVIAARPLFLDVWRKPWGLPLVWHNLRAVGLEVLILGPPAALMIWLTRRPPAPGR